MKEKKVFFWVSKICEHSLSERRAIIESISRWSIVHRLFRNPVLELIRDVITLEVKRDVFDSCRNEFFILTLHTRAEFWGLTKSGACLGWSIIRWCGYQYPKFEGPITVGTVRLQLCMFHYSKRKLKYTISCITCDDIQNCYHKYFYY